MYRYIIYLKRGLSQNCGYFSFPQIIQVISPSLTYNLSIETAMVTGDSPMAPEPAQIYATVAARLIFRAMPWVVERPGAHCDLDGGSSNYGNFIGFDPSPYIYI